MFKIQLAGNCCVQYNTVVWYTLQLSWLQLEVAKRKIAK